MFQVKMTHICTIEQRSSRSYLPPLPPTASTFARFVRFLRKLILITEIHPKSLNFFRSTAEIIDERRSQVKLNSWVIHPFSTFRLYYDMSLSFILIIWMFYISTEACYGFQIGENVYMNSICLALGSFTMLINFSTGFQKNEKIIMTRWEIAGNYLFGIYFIGDLFAILSFLPEEMMSEFADKLCNFLALAKIVRVFSYLKYSETLFTYYRLSNNTQTIIQLITLNILLIHFLACLFPMMAVGAEYFDTDKNFYIKSRRQNLHILSTKMPTDFLSMHIRNVYTACSYILGIDIRFIQGRFWFSYVTAIIGYFIGKFLLTFATVTLINVLKTGNNLEIKYFAMMSQVNAYMKAKNFPITIQKRLREYYSYKYREKYFKEHGVRDYISEKLKKEINYHTCRRLVNNVQIFQSLSRELVEEILHYLRPEIFLPNDLIVKAGADGDCMYFLASGTVAVISPSGKEICHLEDGDYFGEICLLFSNLKRTANVIAVEISEVYRLDRKQFKKSFESNKDLLKKLQFDAKKRYRQTTDIERTFITATTTRHTEQQSGHQL